MSFSGIDAQFSLEGPLLAFTVDRAAGERSYARVHVVPDPGVLAALRATTDVMTLRTSGLPADLSEAAAPPAQDLTV